MENIIIVIDIILAVLLILVILLQKSEGGALGIGVSQENLLFSKSSGNILTKITALIAGLFIICTLSLTIIAKKEAPSGISIIDTQENKEDVNLPKIPKNNN